MNDKDYLYVSLMSNDRFMWNRMTGMGFIIWFDPDGGNKKVFGIQYPVGLQEMGESMMGFEQSDRDREKRNKIIEQSLTEIKFLGSDEDDWDRMLLSDATGIDVEVNNKNSSFVYELKVPLKHGEEHPYAIGVEGEKAIGIGFEMKEVDRNKMMRGRGGMPGGGMGPTAMPPAGMGGPPRGMQKPEMPDPPKLWVKVQLAAQ